jgi:ParB-like chromosome segregation protein Spo0J
MIRRRALWLRRNCSGSKNLSFARAISARISDRTWSNVVTANVKQRSIEQINVEVLKPAPGNPRKHPKKQLKALIKSIESVGWTVPILVDEDDAILAGHGRFQAAKLMGLQMVPCIRLIGLSPEQKRAYRIADNKLALDAIWDMELLAADFQILEGAGFDLNLTGFDLPEIDAVRAWGRRGIDSTVPTRG